MNHRVKSLNLGAVYRTFRDAGARCFIFSGSVSTADEVRLYTSQIPGAALSLCLLRAGPEVIRERFLKRGSPFLCR